MFCLDLQYGEHLTARAFAEEGYSERSPSLTTDNSGMSGTDGIYQTHGVDTDTMWLTVRDPGTHNTIWFDLGGVHQLGPMLVWNYNQLDYTGPGLRDVRIYHSCDGAAWQELCGNGYPYRFARANGAEDLAATNLDDGFHTPVDFAGITARYVKLVPAPEKGVGNWGGYVEGQHRFGLSEIRFYAYLPRVQAGGYIPTNALYPAGDCDSGYLTSGAGLSDRSSKAALHGNDPKTMWISPLQPLVRSVWFDLGGTYPLEEMWVWNYNEPGETGADVRDVGICYSIDRADWQELRGPGYPYRLARAQGLERQPATNLDDGLHSPVNFGGAHARFVRIDLRGGPGKGTWGYYAGYENRFGLSKVRFYAASGWCVEPERTWTDSFSRYNGWSGADGIFMAPLDGVEKQQSSKKTLAVFGDTFIGHADPVRRHRKTFCFANNSAAMLEGCEPDLRNLRFHVHRDVAGAPASIVKPQDAGYYYWFQDCVVTESRFYAFTDNVVDDPSGKEGFRFRLTGVDRVAFDIRQGEVDFDSPQLCHTPFWRTRDGLYFGCSILPNTKEAQMPFADGYIYVYGLLPTEDGSHALCVMRVPEGFFNDFSRYEYFCGDGFGSDLEKCVPICEEGSSEMSVTPIGAGKDAGKYRMTYCAGSISDTICCRIGETPWGPFGPCIPLYFTDEPLRLSAIGGRRVYTYNAKAHYHVSAPGELLVSYNINTMDFESHIRNCDIYRPRFINLRTL